MNVIKGVSNHQNNISAARTKLETGKEVLNNIVAIKNAESPKEALGKITKQLASGEKTDKSLSDKIAGVVRQGVEYFKEVKDRAIQDRNAGLGRFEGADKYWNELLKEAEKIGRSSQDKVLNYFADQTSGLLRDAIKGSKLEKLVGDLVPSIGKVKTETIQASAANVKAGTLNAGIGGALGKATGFVGAAYSVYQLIDGFGKDSPVASAANGATVGAYVGTTIAPGIGTAIGGILGGIGGALMGVFGKKKKNPEHAARDQMRQVLQQAGFIDKDFSLKLADGSSFYIGTDGKKKLDNLNGGKRFGYQFDPTNELSGPAIAMLQPLARFITAGNDRLATDLTGYLVNAATSNVSNLSSLRENVIAIYEQSGASLEDISNVLNEMSEKGMISENRKDAYLGGIMSVADESAMFAIMGKENPNEKIEKANMVLH